MTFRPRPSGQPRERLGSASDREPIGDQRGERDPAGRRDVDGPRQVRRGHPPAGQQGHFLSARDARVERRAVVGRDADQDDPPAGPHGRDRVGQCRVVPGDLEGDVDRLRAERLRAVPRRIAWTDELRPRRPRARAPPRLDEPDGRSRRCSRRRRTAAAGSAAVPAARSRRRRPGRRPRAHRDRARGWPRRAVRAAPPRRPGARPAADGTAGPARPSTTAMRRRSSHDRRTASPGTGSRGRRRTDRRPARVGRVHRDPFARARTADDHGAELVTEHERPAESGVPDRPFLVPVQIRPAESDRGDAQDDLAGTRFLRAFPGDPDVPRRMQSSDVGVGGRGCHRRWSLAVRTTSRPVKRRSRAPN